jgi:hypothetical protein
VFALVGAVGTQAGQPIATAAKVPFIGPFTGAEFDMALVALECALVAAGLLEVARFSSPNIWDVAAGIALVRAGGGVVREHGGMHWAPMQRFAPVSRADEKPDLRASRRPIVVGTKKGVETMCGEMTTHAP